MNRIETIRRQINRRWFLEQCGVGLGTMALGTLLGDSSRWPRLRRSIRCCPSGRITRPRLSASSTCSWPGRRATWICSTTSRNWRSWTVNLPPPELLEGYRAAFINPHSKLLAPKFKFARHGQSGAELSELLPQLATVADDISIVRSLVTDAFNHAPGQIMMNTGTQQFGRPSLGAGRRMGWEAKRAICRASWCSTRPRRAPAAAHPTGAAASCPRSTRACRSAARAIRCCSCRIRRASIGSRSANRSIAGRTERAAARQRGRPGDRHAHQLLRAGLQDANQRAGSDGHLAGIERDARHVRRRAGAAFVCQQLPAGPAAGGTGRAVRAVVS